MNDAISWTPEEIQAALDRMNITLLKKQAARLDVLYTWMHKNNIHRSSILEGTQMEREIVFLEKALADIPQPKGEMKIEDQVGIKGRTLDEAQANARLIAAAPNLLKALKECLLNDGGYCPTMLQAREAIAEAEE